MLSKAKLPGWNIQALESADIVDGAVGFARSTPVAWSGSAYVAPAAPFGDAPRKNTGHSSVSCSKGRDRKRNSSTESAEHWIYPGLEIDQSCDGVSF
jgi:hypothetical protein